MTYCFAIKYNNDAFLLSDTAFTTNEFEKVPAQQTSFGEKTVQGKDETVFEAILKIHKVSNHCAIAFSGYTKRANSIINILMNCYKLEQDLEKSIQTLNNSIDAGGLFVELLIADHSKKNVQIMKWNTANQKLIPVEKFASTGSLPDIHDDQIASIFKKLDDFGKFPKDSMLPIMAAVVQSYGLKNYLMENNVGGSILGVQVSSKGMEWLPDTTYMITEPDGGPKDRVQILCRDNGYATHSSYSQENSYFARADQSGNHKGWINKWSKTFEHQFQNCSSKNWIYINAWTDVIVIIRSRFLTSKTTVSNVSMNDDHEIRTEMDGSLMDFLKKANPGTIVLLTNEDAKEYLDDRCFHMWVAERQQEIMNDLIDQELKILENKQPD